MDEIIIPGCGGLFIIFLIALFLVLTGIVK
jgi:hypothetical protein